MTNVAVTGLNNTDNPAPGVPVAKSLASKYNVTGLAYNAEEPGIYEKHLFDEVFLMPYPTLGLEETLQRLKYVKDKTDINYLIPNLDAELDLYIKYKDKVESMGIKTCLPEFSVYKKREKAELPSFSEKIGLKHPKTYFTDNIKELMKITKKTKFPVMIKGKYYKAYKADNFEEAVRYFYEISNEWGFPIIVQETVTGVELNYVGLADNGKLVSGVGMKKTSVTGLGKVWTGISIKNEKLLQAAKTFVEKTGWNGPFELETIAEGKDLYLIEINPRFPAWVYFAAMLGINLPEALIAVIENDNKYLSKIPADYPEGKMYIRYIEETLGDYNDFIKLTQKKEITKGV